MAGGENALLCPRAALAFVVLQRIPRAGLTARRTSIEASMSRRLTTLTRVLNLTAFYFVGGLLGKETSFVSSGIALVWPPAGEKYAFLPEQRLREAGGREVTSRRLCGRLS
jgi:hypothetical protein